MWKTTTPSFPLAPCRPCLVLEPFHARLNRATHQTVQCRPCLALPNTLVNSSCFVSSLLMGQHDYFCFFEKSLSSLLSWLHLCEPQRVERRLLPAAPNVSGALQRAVCCPAPAPLSFSLVLNCKCPKWEKYFPLILQIQFIPCRAGAWTAEDGATAGQPANQPTDSEPWPGGEIVHLPGCHFKDLFSTYAIQLNVTKVSLWGSFVFIK